MSHTSLLNTFLLSAAYLVLFAVGEVLYHKCKVKVEISRKVVHIGTGLLALLFPLLLDNHWLVLILCAAFAIILVVSLRFGFLPSINAVERKSIGSLAYPVAVYGCYLAFLFSAHQYHYYYLPILVLAVCDPVAGLAGRKWPIGPYTIAGAHKTLMGSAMFLLSALLLVGSYIFVAGHPLTAPAIASILIIAVLATLAEAVSRDGYDNVSIPFSVILGLLLTQSLLA
ncbi:phosphatidate cytidylyltransferase [Sphingobacterium sp. SYP-B4668]|uniref:phosphatidate cytidylyltransferase n=1 Tax=Sphingobacterium sp. SYP-B4668 TaxID=2996035 RepID=UPI0022DD5A8D|nr:phosphatidate cytidylyltransferase [Sphingobacterium sp. SYP-B4668]